MTLAGDGNWQVDARQIPGNFRVGNATFVLVAQAQGSATTAAGTPPVPTVSPSPTPAPTAAAIRFIIGPGVSAADEATVRTAVAAVVVYLRATFGASRDDAVINVLASKTADSRPQDAVGCCSALSGGRVYLDVDDPEWPLANTDKMKIVAHEYSHTFQDVLGGTFGCVGRETDNPKRTPVWFYEGWAEYLAYQVALRNGWYTQAAVATVVARARADAAASSLRMISVPPLRGARGLYTLGYLAADRLTSARGPAAIRDFCTAVGAGSAWQVEFPKAFGLDPNTFQDGFNAYVLALPN